MSTAPLDQPGAVRDENSFDPLRILPFLKTQIPGLADGPLELKQFQGGASNLTYLLKIGGRETILRRPPSGYEWRLVDGNYVLAAVATGVIASIVVASSVH